MKTFNHNGTTYTMRTLMSESGLTYDQVRYRLDKSMPIGDILKGWAPIHYNPKTSLKQIARDHGIDYRTLHGRVTRGMSVEQALQFDPDAAQEAQRKYHTEEERRAAHREAVRRYTNKKRLRMKLRDATYRIHEAETKARQQELAALRKDIRERWLKSEEYQQLKAERKLEARESAHEERRWVREQLKFMIEGCAEGQEKELAEWMLTEVDGDALRVRPVDEFLAQHSGV